MRRHKQQVALITALCVLTAGLPRIPVQYRSAAGERLSAAEFARRSAEAAPGCNADTPFAALRFSETEQQLYRDETAVGRSFAGFALRDGVLCVDADAAGIPGGGWMPAEDAAEYIGCEISVSGEDKVLTSPFQSGRLIVKSEQQPEHHGAVSCTEGYRSLHVLQYDSPAAAYSAYRSLSADSSVTYVEPDQPVHICEQYENADSLLYDRWGQEAVSADGFCRELRSMPGEAPEIVVAVIDTGIYPEHVMFQGRIAEGGRTFAFNETNGCIDGQGHGSHCAGIVCSVTNENVRILPLKALDDTGYGMNLDIYCAMMYAEEQGADVISMSLGGEGESPLLNEACAYLSAKDIPVAVAAGNEAQDVKYVHPANYPDNIVVSALKKEDESYARASFSNFGSMTDFAAPGFEILSAGISEPDEMRYNSGTSMATPFVAGCIADLLSYDPELTNDEIYEILRSGAVDLGEAGFDNDTGWGMVSLAHVQFPGTTGVSPTADPPAGIYHSTQNVSLSCADKRAVIYYTTDGSVPSAENGQRYDGTPIRVTEHMLLAAAAVTSAGTSRPMYAEYEIVSIQPSVSPEGGDYSGPVEVSLSAEGADAIYYTLDGTDPGDGIGVQYTGAFDITETAVLKAVSVLNGKPGEMLREEYVIGGTDPGALYEITDGVLTACRSERTVIDLTVPGESVGLTAVGDGAFEGNSALTEVYLPETVTRIGSKAFAGCTALHSVYAPGVTEIGDEAFRGCAALTGNGLDEEHLRKIGAYAFAGAKLEQWSFISFTELEEIGEYALADTAGLSFVQFGEHLRVIPTGVLHGSAADYISAQGAKTICDYAFTFERTNADDCIRNVSLYNWATELEKIGAHALENCCVGGSALETVTQAGEYAFAGVTAETGMLDLSSLEHVPAHMAEGADAEWLILSNAKTIGSCAVPGSIAHVVTGEALTEMAPDAVTLPLSASFYVGAAGTPAEQFAEANGLFYYTIPAFLPQETEITAGQFDAVTIGAAWFGGTTGYGFRRYADAACTQELPADEYCWESGIYANTDNPGVYYYAAGYYDDGEWHQTGDPVKLTVRPAEVLGEIGQDTRCRIIDWDGIVAEYGYAYDSRLIYGYTPEESGTYYFGADGASEAAVYFPETGELRTVWEDWDSVNKAEEDSFGVELSAGERVLIVLNNHNWDRERTAFLTIRRAAPKILLESCTAGVSEDTFAYTGEAIEPHVTVRRQTGANTVQMLSEGRDYIVYCPQNRCPGEIRYYVVGLGDYAGVLSGSVTAVSTMTGEGELPVYDPEPGEHSITFTPETSGRYTVYTMYLDSELREAVSANDPDRLRLTDSELSVYNEAGELLESNDSIYGSSLSGFTRYFDAGTTYTVGFRCYGKYRSLKICISSGDRTLLTGSADPLFDTVYTGERLDGEIAMHDTDGNLLVSGTDYIHFCFGGERPGEMYLLAIGTGGYYGACWTITSVEYDVAQAIENERYEMLVPDEPFTLDGQVGAYRFSLDLQSLVTFRSLAEHAEDFTLYFYCYNPETECYEQCEALYTQEAAAEGVSLNAGLYFMLLVRDGTGAERYQLSLAESYLNIEDAVVTVGTVWETGEPIALHPTVRYGDQLLTENTDYRLEYSEQVVRCGSYEMYVIGIGAYGGVQTVGFTVQPDPASDRITDFTGSSFTAQINNPGDYVVCRWNAPADKVCMWLDEPEYVQISVMNGVMEPIETYIGNSFCWEELNLKRGRNYCFMISYRNCETTGEITLNLRTDYRLLDNCTADYGRLLQSDAAGAVPEFTVRDGDTVLTEHRDYEVARVGGTTHCALAEITLKGIGDYIGILKLDYFLIPDAERVSALPFPDNTELVLDEEKEIEPEKMDDLKMYWFQAPAAGRYYLNRPDPLYSPAVVYVYQGSTLLPMHAQSAELKEGEKLMFVVTGQALDDYRDTEAEMTISVSSEIFPLFYNDADGLSWMILDDSAELSEYSLPAGDCGIYIPEHAADDGLGIDADFTGMSLDRTAIRLVRERITFYGESGGAVEQWCREMNLCFAAVDPEYTVPGDVTGDGTVNSFDAATLLRWLGGAPGMRMNDAAYQMADTDGDGCVTVSDAYLILQAGGQKQA